LSRSTLAAIETTSADELIVVLEEIKALAEEHLLHLDPTGEDLDLLIGFDFDLDAACRLIEVKLLQPLGAFDHDPQMRADVIATLEEVLEIACSYSDVSG